MAYARTAGLPVREVFDVDGADLVLERVVGPTMTSALARRPWTMAAQARVLAGLHRAVHAVPAPDWLPALGDGGGTALLHLDLHPDNVLLGAGGPVVIDWTNAARGPAELDVADAWLVISTGSVPGSRLQAPVVGAAQGTFARLFRRAAVLDLAPGLAAAGNRRLADRNLNARERQRVRRLAGLSEG